MADKTTSATGANHPSRDPQGRIAQATIIGMSALKPIMQFQVSVLRMWADGIERFAGNYEKGLQEAAADSKEQSNKDRAA